MQLFSRANAIIFVIDAKSGLAAADYVAADWLRRNLKQLPPDNVKVMDSCDQTSTTPIIVVANKCDHYGDSMLLSNALEAASLGFGNPVPYSAETQAGTTDLYDALRPAIDAFHEKKNIVDRVVVEHPGAALNGVAPARPLLYSLLSNAHARVFEETQVNTKPVLCCTL